MTGFALGSSLVLANSLGVALLNQHRYEDKAADNTRQYSEYADQKVAEACRGVAAVELAHCFSEARIESELEKRRYQHDQDDLVAQRKAALWTSIMGVAALLGVGFSVVGVVLLFRSLREAQRQAKAAEDQLRLTVSAMRPQLASVKETVLDEPSRLPEIPFAMEFAVSGSAAMHRLRMLGTYRFRGEGREADLDPSVWSHGTVNSAQPLILHGLLKLSEQELAAVRDGKGVVDIIITGNYSNGFGEDWAYRQDLIFNKESWGKGLLYTRHCQQWRVEKQQEESDASHQPSLDLEGGG